MPGPPPADGRGAAAVVLGGNAAWGPARALAFRPLPIPGRISYSLYLWHWPLLVLPAWYVGDELPVPVRLGFVALAFVTCGGIHDPHRGADPRGAGLAVGADEEDAAWRRCDEGPAGRRGLRGNRRRSAAMAGSWSRGSGGVTAQGPEETDPPLDIGPTPGASVDPLVTLPEDEWRPVGHASGGHERPARSVMPCPGRRAAEIPTLGPPRQARPSPPSPTPTPTAEGPTVAATLQPATAQPEGWRTVYQVPLRRAPSVPDPYNKNYPNPTPTPSPNPHARGAKPPTPSPDTEVPTPSPSPTTAAHLAPAAAPPARHSCPPSRPPRPPRPRRPRRLHRPRTPPRSCHRRAVPVGHPVARRGPPAPPRP